MSNKKVNKKSDTNDALTAKDYERLGRQLETSLVGFASSRRKLLSYNLIIGVIRGFGAVLGATIGIAILLYALSLFTHIPLIGPSVKNIKQTVNTSTAE